ncbi:hypothetical protein ACFQH6_15830 [Halobacteriaceae archaeon GCM10025711]
MPSTLSSLLDAARRLPVTHPRRAFITLLAALFVLVLLVAVAVQLLPA